MSIFSRLFEARLMFYLPLGESLPPSSFLSHILLYINVYMYFVFPLVDFSYLSIRVCRGYQSPKIYCLGNNYTYRSHFWWGLCLELLTRRRNTITLESIGFLREGRYIRVQPLLSCLCLIRVLYRVAVVLVEISFGETCIKVGGDINS